MKKSKPRVSRRLLTVIVTALILTIIIFLILKPVDSYSYSTSGCVGVGTSTHKTERYSIVNGEREKFYQDKEAVPSFKFEFIKASCDSDTETHTLYLF